MRLLLVEDNMQTGVHANHALKSAGFAVDLVRHLDGRKQPPYYRASLLQAITRSIGRQTTLLKPLDGACRLRILSVRSIVHS